MKRLIILMLAVVLIAGCGESKKREQWGQGDLPPDWQQVFGADNGSRMDFVQTNKLNEIDARLKAVEKFLRMEDK